MWKSGKKKGIWKEDEEITAKRENRGKWGFWRAIGVRMSFECLEPNKSRVLIYIEIRHLLHQFVNFRFEARLIIGPAERGAVGRRVVRTPSPKSIGLTFPFGEFFKIKKVGKINWWVFFYLKRSKLKKFNEIVKFLVKKIEKKIYFFFLIKSEK